MKTLLLFILMLSIVLAAYWAQPDEPVRRRIRKISPR